MTNQEAIKILEVAKAECEWNAPLEYQAASDMAIFALQAQDVPDTNDGDMVSRKAAIDALDQIFDRCEEIETHLPEGDPDRTGYKMYPDYMIVWKYLHQSPSAQPEPSERIQDIKAIPDDRDMVCLSERVSATYYDDEHEEWSQKTVTIRDLLDGICDEYTVLPSAQPETCEGCKHLGKWENEVEYGYNSPCTNCKRRMNDNYEQ